MMNNKNLIIIGVVILIVVVGGVFLLGGQQSSTSEDAMMEDGTETSESMEEEDAMTEEDAMIDGDDAMTQSAEVEIANFTFSQATITVEAGTTVTWTNSDSVAHTATSDDGVFDTGLLQQGETGSVTFDEPGTYTYHCTPHPNMTGTVIVE